MSAQERCPLGSGLYWMMEDEERSGGAPSFCNERCYEPAYKSVDAHAPLSTDNFESDEHNCFDNNCDIGYGGTSIQRGQGSERLIGILTICADTGNDVFEETFKHICPHE